MNYIVLGSLISQTDKCAALQVLYLRICRAGEFRPSGTTDERIIFPCCCNATLQLGSPLM